VRAAESALQCMHLSPQGCCALFQKRACCLQPGWTHVHSISTGGGRTWGCAPISPAWQAGAPASYAHLPLLCVQAVEQAYPRVIDEVLHGLQLLLLSEVVWTGRQAHKGSMARATWLAWEKKAHGNLSSSPTGFQGTTPQTLRMH